MKGGSESPISKPEPGSILTVNLLVGSLTVILRASVGAIILQLIDTKPKMKRKHWKLLRTGTPFLS
jgi:hypothetical protein